MARTKQTPRRSSYRSPSQEVEHSSFRSSPAPPPRRCNYSRVHWTALNHPGNPRARPPVYRIKSPVFPKWRANQDQSWKTKHNSVPRPTSSGWGYNSHQVSSWRRYQTRQHTPKSPWTSYGPQAQISELKQEVSALKDTVLTQKALLDIAEVSLDNLRLELAELRHEHSVKLQSLLGLFDDQHESLQSIKCQLKRKAAEPTFTDPGASPHSPVYGPSSDSDESEVEEKPSSLAQKVKEAQAKRRKANTTVCTYSSSSESDNLYD